VLPHPMIAPESRIEAPAREAVARGRRPARRRLGYGAHDDPPALAPICPTLAGGRGPAVVAYLFGTDGGYSGPSTPSSLPLWPRSVCYRAADVRRGRSGRFFSCRPPPRLVRNPSRYVAGAARLPLCHSVPVCGLVQLCPSARRLLEQRVERPLVPRRSRRRPLAGPPPLTHTLVSAPHRPP